MRATGCQCLLTNGCHTQFFWLHRFFHTFFLDRGSAPSTGCQCLVSNGCHTQFLLMHPFLGNHRCMRATGCQCLVLNGCHTLFWDTHMFNPDIGTQWRACTCLSPRKRVHQKKLGVTPIGCQTLAPSGARLPVFCALKCVYPKTPIGCQTLAPSGAHAPVGSQKKARPKKLGVTPIGYQTLAPSGARAPVSLVLQCVYRKKMV